MFDKVTITISANISFVPYERRDVLTQYLSESIYNRFEPNYSQNEAIVIYSSGTTGRSKGIILSHFAINTNADAIIDYMKVGEKDCLYIAKALSHSSVLTGELLVSLKSRAKLVIAPTVVPPRFVLSNIDKFGVTTICLNPTLLQMYVREYKIKPFPLCTLKTIYVSGSILSDKIYMEAHQTFKNIAIYNVYGLSEAGPRVTAQRSDCCKSNSVGKPIKGVNIAIVDEINQEEFRRVFDEMYSLSYYTIEREETVVRQYIDTDGNPYYVEETVTKNVLNIERDTMTASEAADHFSFNAWQREYLDTLMGRDFDEMWTVLVNLPTPFCTKKIKQTLFASHFIVE